MKNSNAARASFMVLFLFAAGWLLAGSNECHPPLYYNDFKVHDVNSDGGPSDVL